MQVFKVVQPGPLTTLQDRGRPNYLNRGISEAGALDEHAYNWGNYLLNNPPNSASLEISISGCKLIAINSIDIVVSGANLYFCINNILAPTWQVITIKKGDILQWIKPISGMRAYLAVNGGFSAQKYFGSVSANLREKIGKKIAANHILNTNSNTNNNYKTMPREFIPNYNQHLTLSILFNNNNYFTQQNCEQLIKTSWTISNKNDRSAYQLKPNNISPKVRQFYSEANCYGSLQITPSGTPIIMLRDRPTIGGYPKIGTIFSLSLAQLAQRGTGDNIRFKPISIKDMQNQRIKFNNFFNLK